MAPKAIAIEAILMPDDRLHDRNQSFRYMAAALVLFVVAEGLLIYAYQIAGRGL